MMRRLLRIAWINAYPIFFVLSVAIFSSTVQADCLLWNIGGTWTIRQSNGTTLTWELKQTGSVVHGRGQFRTPGPGGDAFDTAVDLPIHGQIYDGNIDLVADWGGTYRGGVGSDAFIGGNTFETQHPANNASWRGDRPATCAQQGEVGPNGTSPGNPVNADDTRFDLPMIWDHSGRVRQLDGCRVWANECGQAAANAFCQQATGDPKEAALNFAFREHAGADSPTFTIGDKRLCQGPGCTGFASITCARSRILGTRPACKLATANDDVDIYNAPAPGGTPFKDANGSNIFMPAGTKACVLGHQPGWYDLQTNPQGWVAEDHLTVAQ